MPGAFPRATDALERCLARALPDLRESRSEAYRAGARAHYTLVDLACLPFAGVPLRAVPSQILLNSAEALRGHGRTFARGLTDRIPAGRRETKPGAALAEPACSGAQQIKSGSREPGFAESRRARRSRWHRGTWGRSCLP